MGNGIGKTVLDVRRVLSELGIPFERFEQWNSKASAPRQLPLANHCIDEHRPVPNWAEPESAASREEVS